MACLEPMSPFPRVWALLQVQALPESDLAALGAPIWAPLCAALPHLLTTTLDSAVACSSTARGSDVSADVECPVAAATSLLRVVLLRCGVAGMRTNAGQVLPGVVSPAAAAAGAAVAVLVFALLALFATLYFRAMPEEEGL